MEWRPEGKFEVGVFLRRLNRFMVEVALDDSKVLAHLSNSGKLVTVLAPKAMAFLREESRVGRKTNYDMFAVQHSGVHIIVDTRFSTVAAKLAVEKREFESLRGFSVLKENAKVDHSFIDLLLQRDGKRFFLEVKCVTHVVAHVTMFPDAPTVRGRKHLVTLMKLAESDVGAGVLFSVQRPDAKRIRPYHEMDPEFAVLLREAVDKGVRVFTQTVTFKPPGIISVKSNSPRFSSSEN